jgi:hypothetical protein
MRILARTLIIIATALAVAGGTFALGQSSYAQTRLLARPARAVGVEGSSATTAGTQTTLNDGVPFGRQEHEGSRSASLFGAVEVFKNLAIISIIVAIVSLIKRIWGGRQPDMLL